MYLEGLIYLFKYYFNTRKIPQTFKFLEKTEFSKYNQNTINEIFNDISDIFFLGRNIMYFNH